MKATAEDVQRIIMEQILVADDQDASDYRELADAWAESNGLEEGTMAMICNGIIGAFDQALIELATDLTDLEGAEVTEIHGEPYVEANPLAFQQALEMVLLSAFRWGFETARQLR